MKRLDQEQLYHTLHARLEEDMRLSRVSGAQILVMQEGQTVCSLAGGYQNLDDGTPVTEDTIFRLASMTKPVTAIAALIAVEKGWFGLDDLLSDHLPAFSQMQVAVVEDGKIVGCKAVENPLRIWHLLSHCNGMMSSDPIGWEIGEATPKEAFASIETMVDYAATRPLAFEPESYACYTARVSFDVVARLIELKSGMPYADFIQKHIFAPLGLQDMTYHPTEQQWKRLTVPTDRTDGKGLVTVNMGRHTYEGLPLTYTCAGAGLVATMADYQVFAQMLQNRGAYPGGRLVSEETFQEMVKPRVKTGTPGLGPISSWGLGVKVITKEEVLPVGSFGWSGAYGTYFWVDPVNKITAIYLRSSRWYDSHGCGDIGKQFEKDVMACLQ